jgi:hypothetical protein
MRGGWLLAIGLLGCAGPQGEAPDSLRFPPGESAVLRAKAAGVQIYECATTAQNPAKYDWVLRGPEAQLYDAAGTLVGRHYAGPTWEALDGSKVVGEVRAHVDTPGAIPWLLLSARSTGGSGKLARVKSIQRLDTVGGKIETGCTAAEAGRTLRVAYSAIYVFSEAR